MADDNCNTDTEEGTIALQRKKSRRVSFAENTMVHIFDRDDEYETPPEPKPTSSDDPSEMLPSFKCFDELGFNQDSSDSKEYSQNKEDDDEEDLDQLDSFLRPVESPSSGSIIGSATSDDDFFGPVSASFIKPGRSSSSSSDENNDVTKDSTFFSMQFRSIARSESGDLKTSTDFNLSLEEKTPTQDSGPTNQGSSMVLTAAKKPNVLSFTPIAKSSGGNDSNDMSLVGGSPKKYDFGILSPALDALLLDDNSNASKLPINTEGNLTDLSEDGDVEIAGISHIMPKEGMQVSLSPPGLNFSAVNNTDSNIDIQRVSQFTHKEYKSPMTGFILDTPSQKQISSLLDESIVIHSRSAASVQKSISRLAMLEASPFYSTPDANIKHLTVKSLDSLFKTTPKENLLDQNSTEHRNSEDELSTSVTSPESQTSLSKDLSVNVENHTTIDDKLGSVIIEKTNMENSPNSIDKMDSAAMGIISLPVTVIDNSKSVSAVEMEDERETNPHALKDNSGNTGSSPIFLRDNNLQNVECTTPDERVNNNICASASSFASSSEVSIQKNLLEVFSGSPSRKEIQNDTHNDIIPSLVLEDGLSPNSGRLKNRLRSSSAKKRKNGDHTKEIASTQRSPKLHKGSNHDLESLEHQNENNRDTSGDKETKHWTDSYSKFLEDTEKILSLSGDKLNLHEIDLLGDILDRTQRSRTYEILQAQLQSQKMFDPHNNIQHKRVTETRLELQKILHERLKLKLMRVKREKLLKKMQLVKSGIQESQLLKSSYLPQRSISIEVNNGYQQPSEDIQEVDRDKTALQQALEISQRKIMSLIKKFNTSCKMNGDPGCADTILSVNNHLVKISQGRFIRLDSQLWVIDSLENKNGRHNVVLNYLGFNTQRLNISEGPVSQLSISNIFNYAKIDKSLPDMDICTAFSFVFQSEATRKCIGHRSLPQETQTSNSLLGNLLDVAEEIQQARMELRNLTQTSFHSRSAEQLDLQLCFFDFENGRRAILTLDMSCLNRGIYPSDIIPSFPANGSQNSLSEQLLDEIRGAVQNLGAGYFRIIRLCRCISQVVQASAR